MHDKWQTTETHICSIYDKVLISIEEHIWVNKTKISNVIERWETHMNRLVTEEEMQMVKKHEKMYNLTFQVDNINKMVSKVWGN